MRTLVVFASFFALNKKKESLKTWKKKEKRKRNASQNNDKKVDTGRGQMHSHGQRSQDGEVRRIKALVTREAPLSISAQNSLAGQNKFARRAPSSKSFPLLVYQFAPSNSLRHPNPAATKKSWVAFLFLTRC